jgi:hypothetical protein
VDGIETEDAETMPYLDVTSDSPSIPGLLIVYAPPGIPAASPPPGPMIMGYPYILTFATLFAPAGGAHAAASKTAHARQNVYLAIQHPFNIMIR